MLLLLLLLPEGTNHYHTTAAELTQGQRSEFDLQRSTISTREIGVCPHSNCYVVLAREAPDVSQWCHDSLFRFALPLVF